MPSSIHQVCFRLWEEPVAVCQQASWTTGIDMQFAMLGMASPFISSEVLLTVIPSGVKWQRADNRPEMACMCCLGQLPRRGQSCACIVIGLAT